MAKNYLSFALFVCLFFGACKPTSNPQNNDFEEEINTLLSKMDLEQKIGQTALRGTSSRMKGPLSEELKALVRKGQAGAVLNVMNPEYVDELQHIAVDESPNGIPLIFARDIIHGFKTIFPIPIGMAASWDSTVAESSARISAIESSSLGIRWTFSPMLDIVRDSRWGRVAESPGEDPYLASVLARAYVKGYQGEKLSDSTSILACAKHFIGYGAAIGGRDYNTVIIHEPLLRNVYLPPFQAAINAGAQTVMSSFNELNGIPVSGSKFLLSDVLRKDLNFDGFVVSDWNSVTEMIAHGYARDEKHAAELSSNAGLDMEMTSESYQKYIKELIEERKLSEKQLDFYVKNILRIKFRLGLFNKPYRNKQQSGKFYDSEHLKKAGDAAAKSFVLLKNNNILPFKSGSKIAMIGPLSDAPREQLGTWTFDGEAKHTITPLNAFKSKEISFVHANGLNYSRDKSKSGFNEAISAAKSSDIILFIGGEEAILSGEAHSRADISLPGVQEDLIDELAKTGKPIVLVIMAGRPITITRIIDKVDAVMMVWHPGTMGGAAMYDVLYGFKEPGGRLPITWPKSAGQLPLYYNHKNTGRPADSASFVQIDDIPVGAWQSSLGNKSHYLDAGFTPHFPFGYGLSYTSFKYSNLEISKTKIKIGETLEIKTTISNIGKRKGAEVVQLYIQDVVGSITRPVKELKAFKKIEIDQGKEKVVVFEISTKDLAFVNQKLEKQCEPGMFNVWVGPNSASGLKATFYVEK